MSRYGNLERRIGAAIIVKSDKTEIKDYLLGRLPEADEADLELRLLSDPSLGEEFDTLVDEITDEYLQGELPDDERQRVQQYFLSSPERQKKLEFANELLRRAGVREKKETRPSFQERIAAFWRQQSFAQVATTVAAVIIVVGIIFVLTRDNSQYLALNLAISTAERAEGPATERVKLPSNTGLKIVLTIPESARGAKDYMPRLATGTELEIVERTDNTVTVKVPAKLLKPGAYAIQLSKIKPDNTPERITGSYYFAVE